MDTNILVLLESMSVKDRKSVVTMFADLLRSHVSPSPLHEVLHEAANRAGWTTRSAKAEERQRAAAKGRKIQREEDLAVRRVLVAYIFRQLGPRRRAQPGSTGTAQAIIGKLEDLNFKRRPPITVRTIQEDIRYMRENGNFGI
jgi:hypothetical protein